MTDNNFLTKTKHKDFGRIQLILFIFLLIIFVGYAIFLAFNLQTGIIPDESHRFGVSKYLVNTWGIPKDIPLTKISGEYIRQGSFLGYWIYARLLSIFITFAPSATEWQLLVFLRLMNALFSLGTVVFVYQISRKIINNKWIQLLPVFMITNTLMFVFLSGGVNYDNPAIFFCTVSLYYFIKSIKDEEFIVSSLTWLVMISTASLIKYSILPLAFIMVVLWVVFYIKTKPVVSFRKLMRFKELFLALVLLILLACNFSIYGLNIIRYHSLQPQCYDVYPEEICDVSTYVVRHRNLALPEKRNVFQAFKQGDPEPIRYIYDYWIRTMMDRIFGIMGHKIYFPINVSYFHLLAFWSFGLGMRYIRKPNFSIISIIIIIVFYALTLVQMNYRSELTYGFGTSIALQGRYIFPVITLMFVFWGYILECVSNKLIQYTTIGVLIALFIYSGPMRFIMYYQTVFADWFI